VPRGPAALPAAVLRRIAPWTRRSGGGRGSGGGSDDGIDDIDAMLQHDAAEVSTMPSVCRASQSCCSLLRGITLYSCKDASSAHLKQAAMTCVKQSQDARLWRMSARHAAAHASSTAASDIAAGRAIDKTALHAEDSAGNLLLY
jgi:hypothetical protein